MARVLRGLTGAQYEAVTSEASPLCVIAGAGSGKTRVLTHRIAKRVLDGSADPERTMVLTFTRKAAGELRSRLGHLGVPHSVTAGTFHALAYAQLRRRWADMSVRPPAVCDSPARVIRPLIAQATGRPPDPAMTYAVSNEISWARARLVDPDRYGLEASRAGRQSIDPELVSRVYGEYTTAKKRKGLVDLDDLMEHCAIALETDSTFSSAQRWLFRHFFVDEMQDLNPAQWRLLRGWLADRDDVFVVGDPHQAIYSWNGADPTLLNRITELMPDMTVLRLDDNHRCAPEVVDVARSVLGGAAAESIRSAREDLTGQVEVRDFEDDERESNALARWLRDHHAPGRSWSSFAVLARTNARLEPVAQALARAGIPFVRREQAATGSEVSALAALRSLPKNTPLRQALASISTEEEDIEWLAREVDSICSEFPEADVGQLLSTRALGAADAGDSYKKTKDAVQVLTFHRAKGLEWTSVAVVGLESGMVPIAHAVRSEALDEERRLLYVALTRAEREIWCSWAEKRTTEDRSWNCEPSPYLSAIRLAARVVADCDPVPASTHIAELRSKLTVAG